MAHRNRWFTVLKDGWIFPWRTVSHNQMVYYIILPSGKLTKNYGKIHHFWWVNPRTFDWAIFNSLMGFDGAIKVTWGLEKSVTKIEVFRCVYWLSSIHVTDFPARHVSWHRRVYSVVDVYISHFNHQPVELWHTVPHVSFKRKWGHILDIAFTHVASDHQVSYHLTNSLTPAVAKVYAKVV